HALLDECDSNALVVDLLWHESLIFVVQAEDGIRDRNVTGVQTCALPISGQIKQPHGEATVLAQRKVESPDPQDQPAVLRILQDVGTAEKGDCSAVPTRSEEHTSELQSRFDLVCRLLLEKKKQQ